MNPNKPIALAVLVAVMNVAVAQRGQRLAAPPVGDGQVAEQAPPASLSAAWQLALSTMCTHKAPGLVFVLPPAEAVADPQLAAAALTAFHGSGIGKVPVDIRTERDRLLVLVQLLRQPRPLIPGPEAVDVGAIPTLPLALAFGLAVPVVATAEQCVAAPGETLLVLGEDGRRLAGFRIDLGDADAVAMALQPLLFAAARLQARQANVPPDLAATVADFLELNRQQQQAQRNGVPFDGPAAQRHAQLYQDVRQRLFAAAPALVAAARTAPEADASAEPTGFAADGRAVLGELLQWTTPLGTAVAQTWDPCPACGMAAMPMPFRSALLLLAE